MDPFLPGLDPFAVAPEFVHADLASFIGLLEGNCRIKARCSLLESQREDLLPKILALTGCSRF
jgi:hypothetical protein